MYIGKHFHWNWCVGPYCNTRVFMNLFAKAIQRRWLVWESNRMRTIPLQFRKWRDFFCAKRTKFHCIHLRKKLFWKRFSGFKRYSILLDPLLFPSRWIWKMLGNEFLERCYKHCLRTDILTDFKPVFLVFNNRLDLARQTTEIKG